MDGRGLSRSGVRIRGRARPAELVGLILALHEREGLEERERRRLDREIGASMLTGDGDGPGRGARAAASRAAPEALPWLRRWLAEAPGPGLRERIRRLASGLAGLAALLLGVGLFLGWAAASALLSFEVHAGRINVVASVAVLVLLPFVTWVIGLVTAVVARSSAGLPVLPFGSWLRGGVLGRLLPRVLPQGVREDLEILLGRMGAGGRLYRDVRRSLLLHWSQILGLGFGLGTLFATLLYVVFTDLAFGWSTTLDVDAAPVHRFVQLLSLPWAELWPAATPSLELVEATRYFRVEAGEHVHVVDPIVYGGWWPFLVMAIAVYGVLPRLLSVVVCSRLLGRATARAMVATPGVDRLLDRLTTPFVDTRSPAAETSEAGAAWDLAPERSLASWRAASSTPPIVIRWAEVGDPAALRRMATDAPDFAGATGPPVHEAGGRRSLSEDAMVLEAAGAASEAILLCVRAYEPPMLELLDFLAALRARVGPEREVAVALLEGRPKDRETWRRKLATLGDPRLVVVCPAAPDAAAARDAGDAPAGAKSPVPDAAEGTEDD